MRNKDSKRLRKTPPWRPPDGWTAHCRRQAMDVGLIDMALKRMEEGELLENYDWLGVSIARLGGIGLTARAIGVQRETIYNWLESGLSDVKFANVVALAEASHIPLAQLAERMGPFKPRPNIQSRNKRKTK